MIIAVGGVFDPRIFLDDVVMPVLKKWRIFDCEDFTGEVARMRDDLGLLVEELEEACVKFEVAEQRRLQRAARKAEKLAAKKGLASSSNPIGLSHRQFGGIGCGGGRASSGLDDTTKGQGRPSTRRTACFREPGSSSGIACAEAGNDVAEAEGEWVFELGVGA